MPKETLAARVTRIEENMADLTGKMNILADAQIKTEDRFQEVGARFEEMGARIENLVSAIGELISRIPPQPLR